QEAFSSPRLQLAPELIRPPQQLHIRGILVVRESDDPCHAVGRSKFVRNREALQAEHVPTAAGELEHGRTPHPADADDDRIEALATQPIERTAAGLASLEAVAEALARGAR